MEEKLRVPISEDNPSIYRIEEKCIHCGRCNYVCSELQNIKYDRRKMKDHPICIHCGKCIQNCPTGAMVPKYCYKKVMDYLKDTDKIMVIQTAPAVRTSLGEEFGILENVEKKMVTAFRKCGFDYVFDTTFGADLTVMEEAKEIVSKIESGEKFTQFTSCCPAWVKYVEIYHPSLTKYLSTCKSPISMFGSMIKNYFSEMAGIDPEKIISVVVAPCTAKKQERELFPDHDFVLTVSEVSMMFRELGISFCELEDGEFSELFDRGSGAGVLFGNSGGVTEAVLRCVHYFLMGMFPPKQFFSMEEVRGNEAIKEVVVEVAGKPLHLLVCSGIKNIEGYLQELEKDPLHFPYDMIEVMACDGGCIGGGGQPVGSIVKQQEIIQRRMQILYEEDQTLKNKVSYENQNIIDLYQSYLFEIGGEKARRLLHRDYCDRSSLLTE